MADPKLGNLPKSLIVTVLALIEPSLLSLIKDEQGAQALTISFDLTEDIVEALADSNENDGEQIRQIVLGSLGRNYLPLAEDVLQEVTAKIPDDFIRQGVNLFADQSLVSIALMVDDNPQNGAQLADSWKEFILSDQVEIWLLQAVHRVFEARLGQPGANFIQDILQSAVANFVDPNL